MPPMMQLMRSPDASGFYSTRVFLKATNSSPDAVACAVFERFESSLDPCLTSRHELCHRSCNWCSDYSTYEVPRSIVPRLVAASGYLEDVSLKAPGVYVALKQRLLICKRMGLYSSVCQYRLVLVAMKLPQLVHKDKQRS